MSNRRTFMQSAAIIAGGLPIAKSLQAQQPTRSDTAAPSSAVGGYHYQLPKLDKGSRFLFQGDSITDMKWGRNEADRNHYLGHGYVYLIAARLGVDMPDAEWEFFNRGHSGNTVGDLRKRWQTDAIELKPDVLSILIGVNDVGRMIRGSQERLPLEQWEQDYRAILDASREVNPQLKIVLLEPFVLPSARFGDSYSAWRRATDQLRAIVAALTRDYAATHIHTQQIFDDATQVTRPEHWIWDGVHPLPQGHELIARNWIQRVSES